LPNFLATKHNPFMAYPLEQQKNRMLAKR
jgi:hypothetical protein